MSQATLSARQTVFLCLERGIERKHAEETAAWFERCPGPVAVRVEASQVQLSPNPDGELAWTEVFSTLQKVRQEKQMAASDFLLVLTKTPNELNWYAAQDPQQVRNGFVHVADFEWVTSAPASVVAAHYTLKTIFNVLLVEAGVPWERMAHEVARGCFFDFCCKKEDLNLKLRTADICGDCLETFRSAGIPDPLLKQAVAIMEGCRRLAVNTAQFLEGESFT
jgi:hypothetical protein